MIGHCLERLGRGKVGRGRCYCNCDGMSIGRVKPIRSSQAHVLGLSRVMKMDFVSNVCCDARGN